MPWPLLALAAVLTLAATAAAEEPPTPEESPPPTTDPESLAILRQRLLENLRQWKQLDEAARQQVRQHIRQVLSAGEQQPLRGLRNLRRLQALSKDARERLRARAGDLRKRFREHSQREREQIRQHREQIEKLDPEARKRYLYLRRILRELPHAEQERLRNLPTEERKSETGRLLLGKRGVGVFLRDAEHVSPAARRRLEEMPDQPLQALLREWMRVPNPNLRGFLMRHELLFPDDPPGRGGRPPRSGGGPEGPPPSGGGGGPENPPPPGSGGANGPPPRGGGHPPPPAGGQPQPPR